MSGWIGIIQQLLRIFCGNTTQDQNNQQQQQQQQQQPFGQYPGQAQPSYPPQQQPQHQGQSWSQVAGGGQQQGGSAAAYYGSGNQQPQQQQQPYHGQGQHHGDQSGGHGAWNGGNNGQNRPHGIPAGGIIGPHHPAYQNDNAINSANEHYKQLRDSARREGDEAHRCFAQSQNAYKAGDGGRAHELSVEGKAHAKRQDELDDEASSWIFVENNRDSPPGTIDLHGLYVREAIERTEKAIADAQRQGGGELRVIVGKGIHSQGHVAKIKPAVEDLMRKYNLSAHIDPHNTGVLIVDLSGQTGGGRTRDAGGLVDEMERKEGDCVIM